MNKSAPLNLNKILIAEDLESIAAGIEEVLKKQNVEVVHTRYCDDAWLKLKKAQLDAAPFDLIISDLSFKPDHRKVIIKNGEDLIRTIRQDNIPGKLIVFSIEDRPLKVRQLFDRYAIDGYVLKGRNDVKDLPKAIGEIAEGHKFISEAIREKIHLQKSLRQVEEMDIQIILHLCNGLTQEEISKLFQEKNIRPSSVSTIEKRLKNLREDFSAKTNIELVLAFKDLGLV